MYDNAMTMSKRERHGRAEPSRGGFFVGPARPAPAGEAAVRRGGRR